MMIEQFKALIETQQYLITTLSNTSAFFKEQLVDTNWAGYYLYEDGQLVLGPFQGLMACEIIPLNKGVCGACATRKETVLVEDVHQFPGHIACDSASNSEIVVPIMVNGQLYGLLDIDSPLYNRFTLEDKANLEACVKLLEEKIASYLK